MPPKSRSTSLIQSPSETSRYRVDQTQLLFDFYYPPVEEDPKQAATQNQPQQTATAQVSAQVDTDTPILRGVRVKPQVPEARRGKEPSLQIKQLWEGTVKDVLDNGFLAVLVDKSHPNLPEEQVEFESVELREDDKPLVKPGSVFYWMIGTERTPSGQVRNVSNIEFSRLPIWTRNSLNAAAQRESGLGTWFHANGNRPS